MATKRHRLSVSFTTEEKAHVTALASQLKLSISELLRRLVLGLSLPDPRDFAHASAVLDLIKINADLARLGNLFKLALDEPRFTEAERIEMRQNRLEIIATKELLKAAILDFHRLLHPGSK